MKIKKFSQNIFKNFFQFLFKIVYGKVIYSNHNLKNKNIAIVSIAILGYNNNETMYVIAV